jgi:transcriptional regulator with XRE-family HTH domain
MNEPKHRRLIEKIIAAIEARGTSQAAVERACGLAENRISKWYNRGHPDHDEIYRMARHLRVSLSYLCDDRRPVTLAPPAEVEAVDPALTLQAQRLLQEQQRYGLSIAEALPGFELAAEMANQGLSAAWAITGLKLATIARTLRLADGIINPAMVRQLARVANIEARAAAARTGADEDEEDQVPRRLVSTLQPPEEEGRKTRGRPISRPIPGPTPAPNRAPAAGPKKKKA